MNKNNKYSRSFFWMRRDIRLTDNAALQKCLNNSEKITIGFIFDPHIIENLSPKSLKKSKSSSQVLIDRRLKFICEAIDSIDSQLKTLGVQVQLFFGQPEKILPSYLEENKYQALFFNRDYEPYAVDRDERVSNAVMNKKIEVQNFKDHVIFEYNEILKKDGTPYLVYTPYKNKWREEFESSFHSHKLNSFKSKQTIDKKKSKCFILQKDLPKKYHRDICSHSFLTHKIKEHIGFKTDTFVEFAEPPIQGSHEMALKTLKAFAPKIQRYNQQRDFPAQKGTSEISPYIRHGLLSIRQLFNFALNKEKSKGQETWTNELIWREFYQMIIAHFPHAAMGALKKEYNDIEWEGDRELFNSWCNGETGYPIVDAAMRCFNQTGLMHNRLRMIVASFLCKTLLVNWRWGEDYFAKNLFDFDLAANNGGWQWSASTGTDAQPYFRIFNPYNQSEKFDPEGVFIRKYCPELAGLNNKRIHAPHLADMLEQAEAKCTIGKDYPMPIVDYKIQREKALKMYKKIK